MGRDGFAVPSAGPGAGLRRHAFGLFVAALIAAAFFPTLVEMVAEWRLRPEYSHGFIMPPVALWVLWDRRERLRALPKRPSLAGALLLLPCLALLLLGEMKLSWFLKPYAFVGAVACCVWALYGWKTCRACLPAFIVLLLMCPLPGRVENAITLPLKRTAALLATGLLDLSGIGASLEGNLIRCPGIETLWIADACSGIRSLISLGSIAILVSFFWSARLFVRLLVIVSAVPIAIAVNSLRIWLTGFLSVHVSPESAQGFFHFFEGFALFAVAALLLLGWALLLGQLFPRARAAA